MIRLYKGIKEDFTWKPRFEHIKKDGQNYSGHAFGIYWLRFGTSIVLLERYYDSLLEETPGMWDKDRSE